MQNIYIPLKNSTTFVNFTLH